MKKQEHVPVQNEILAKRQYWTSISIIGTLFFIFGFITWLNGILIPYLEIACELTTFQSLMVAFAFYISYTFMALPASQVLKITGFKNGMVTGLFIMAFGALVFIPAALMRVYGIFLAGLFIQGTGLTLLQTASNPYITIIGPRETAAKRISIMGICNKIAGALAPLILAYFILSDGDAFVEKLGTLGNIERTAALDELASRVIAPYIVIAAVLAILAMAVRISPLPEIETEQEDTEHRMLSSSRNSIFKFPHLWLGALALFLYVGVEVIAGDTIIRYGIALGIPIAQAKAFTTYTLLLMVAGYVLLGIILIPRVISQRTALKISAVLGMVFTLSAIFTEGITSILFIALLGFANALVWPAIWPLAIHNLGRFIKTGSSVLIMMIAGGALLPLLWGKLADVSQDHPQSAYWICLPCYLYILYYAISGYRAGIKDEPEKPGVKNPGTIQ
ncbi:MAG: sugar MFS transporter [Bacteroidales bacterium]|nr:sugar MFS transporter [Bacteroidales bacterium]